MNATLPFPTPIPAVSSAKKVGLWLGPVGFATVAFVLPEVLALPARPCAAAGVLFWMCAWWFTEAVSTTVASCLPFGLFVLTGVYEGALAERVRASVEPALDAYLLLFLGGMVIGAAMEESGLHRRLALRIIGVVGSSPRRLLAGVLLATAFVSMWISNTATAVMMVPIALAVSAAVGAQHKPFRMSLLLGVAYASSIGGIATKIGSSTNSVFAAFIGEHLGQEVSFLGYFVLAAPLSLLLLPVTWLLLWRVGRVSEPVTVSLAASTQPMSRAERTTAAVFILAAAMWTVSDVVSTHVGLSGKQVEALIALAAALLLITSRSVSFSQLRKMPLSTLVLMGGSFALAAGMMKSGLSAEIGRSFAAVRHLPQLAQLGIATTVTIAMSAVASNTATANVMLNVLPRSLPILTASAFAASCDFALPAGTPPNAIVFATGDVSLKDMMRVGVLLDLAAAALVTVYAFVWIGNVG